MPTNLLSRIPSVDRILQQPGIQSLVEEHSRSFVLALVDIALNELREDIKRDALSPEDLGRRVSELETRLEDLVQERRRLSLTRLVNASGVIIYTNAGRAPLSPALVDEVNERITAYTNLEYDLARGVRGHRDVHIESRITRILDCEAATVCNNAAGAVLLILNTLAQGRKVLVSRGELVEIGGSFRIPEIMEKSGAVLTEVGTTNKTRASDYERAMDEETALILRVHQSNYRILGFTQMPEVKEIAEIAHTRGVPLVHDIGSGYLSRTDHPSLQKEPTVCGSLSAGSDLVCFSGDKLLGGPQAGLIVGRKQLVERVRKNPLMRALRVDKMRYSALDWTLLQYETGRFEQVLPVWRFISEAAESIRARALSIREKITSPSLVVELREGFSLTGGGSAPEEQIPTWLLALASTRQSPNQIEGFLRGYEVPILARIESDRVLLDLRTVFPDQDELIVSALNELA